jgi:hypothetical protein
LEWLDRVVSNHVSHGTPYYRHLFLYYYIGDEEKPNVDVLCALAARSLSIIFFQTNRTFVVLKQNIVLDAIALRLHEILCPTDLRHEVVSSHDFRFRGASSIELLLSGAHDGKSMSQR